MLYTRKLPTYGWICSTLRKRKCVNRIAYVLQGKRYDATCNAAYVRVCYTNTFGNDSKEDPPVPIPNTEVKLLNVDDTWRVTAWESRKLPERINTKDNDREVVIFGV